MGRRKDLSRWHCKAGGFTLPELALVLGIAGLVLGAIWVAVSAVQSSRTATKAIGEMQAVANNVRTLYGAQGGFQNTGDITLKMITAGMFPDDMVNKPPAPTGAHSAWGTPVIIQVIDAGSFLITDQGRTGNTVEMCTRMLSRAVGNGRDTGLVQVRRGDGATADPTGLSMPAVTNGSQAATFCAGYAGGGGYGLKFQLK